MAYISTYHVWDEKEVRSSPPRIGAQNIMGGKHIQRSALAAQIAPGQLPVAADAADQRRLAYVIGGN
jgi:hypothetical protein